MSTLHANAGATADKATAGTAGKVIETKGSTTTLGAETKDSSAKTALKSDPKASVSDTKAPETDANTTEVAGKAKELIDSALDAAASTTPPAETGKMVDIKMLRSHPRLAYSAGDKGRIPQSLFDELRADGEFFEKI